MTGHVPDISASPWIMKYYHLVEDKGEVLDLACGRGRHGRLFVERAHPVVFVDKNTSKVNDLSKNDLVTIVETDLEDGSDWPFQKGRFAAILVANYLYRPNFEFLLSSLKPGGVLIYETFALGNEEMGRPRNPDFLLKTGELLDLVQGRLQVVAYEHGFWDKDTAPRVIQRICAVNDLALSTRDDGEPIAHCLHGNS